jgi:hypothetical protein
MRTFIASVAVSLAAAVGLSGCMWEVGGGTATGMGGGPGGPAISLSGFVVGTPITGSLQGTFLLSGFPDADLCLPMAGTITLSGLLGSVTKQETGRLCNVAPGSVGQPILTGQYTVTGSTGIYAGATGTGSTTFRFQNFGVAGASFSVEEIGTFEVPGMASAASARKRTFRTEGKISKAKLCKPAAKPQISKRGCVKLTRKHIKTMLSG